jgi:hypothetical protein
MNILYNYKPFINPKLGVFEVDSGVYKFPNGWIQNIEEKLIIGEADGMYVYKLYESGHGEWIEDKVIQKTYIMPLGINKSRLLNWKSNQLSLFP